ncbi:MAG: bifunctional ornithine acetyltransferase/N-acetylglutamate synthase [Lachnospiraceae bacterium]|nr:bifunctional ornithine acetyltransferase/N-acetylglutamate synthase [Lachnospiraceae bacterium]
MKKIAGGVTAAAGFYAAGCEAGIKYKNRMDMALVYSDSDCVAAGCFTSNVVKAAPVIWDRNIVEKGNKVRAVVVNSGIANACTGQEGMDICEGTAAYAGECLGVSKDSVLVASTGVIGMQMNPDKLKNGIDILKDKKKHDEASGLDAAKAIMTTDTVHKQIAVTFEIGGKTVTLGGMCKGSGMIHPNMCTMLAFLTSDVNITDEMVKKALKSACDDSFNMISVDGDTSTNDTLLIMANAKAGNPVIDKEGADFDIFMEALLYVTQTLAKKMAGDGEGATALVECKVKGAASKQDARILSKSVICSSLTKAAIFGHDANWGRILCALGYSGVQFDPNKIELFFVGEDRRVCLFEKGAPASYSEEEAGSLLSGKEVYIEVVMHEGDGEACAWGCDLSYDYVKINADYRS